MGVRQAKRPKQFGDGNTKLNDDRAEWREARVLFPGDGAYVWHGTLHSSTLAESLVAVGVSVRLQNIWAVDLHPELSR